MSIDLPDLLNQNPTNSNQIGVNVVDPVTTVITQTDALSINPQATGNPGSNIGSIGVNTDLLTEDGGTTKWIGKNTAYLTELVQTTTISGAASVITEAPSMEIVGAVDDDGVPTGAFDFIVSPMILSQIQNLANTYCKDQTTCSSDFPPRVEALLRDGGSILTKRQTGGAVAAGGVILAIGSSPKVQDFFYHVVTAVSIYLSRLYHY